MNLDKSCISETPAAGTPFDPSIFRDPFALSTEWTPAASGGTNIGSHYLNQPTPTRIEFKARPTALLFPLLFLLLGIALEVIGIVRVTAKDFIAPVICIPGGIVFFGAGFFIMRSWLMPRTFDLDIGYYWTGKTNPLETACLDITAACQLADIHAIQILDELCTGTSHRGRRRQSYHSYELNLVLEDATRINVVDHGRHYQLRADAKKLAAFLDVPLWDATLT